jgi:hypothetical protein
MPSSTMLEAALCARHEGSILSAADPFPNLTLVIAGFAAEEAKAI